VRARYGVRPDAGVDRKGRPYKRGPHRTGRCLRRVEHGEGFASWARMLGEQLDHVLEELDVPADELAAAIGVEGSLVRKWILGTRTPSTRRLKQIADALGVLVADLMPRAS
jgi:transcriptional regulator with XRE-family HTH domain